MDQNNTNANAIFSIFRGMYYALSFTKTQHWQCWALFMCSCVWQGGTLVIHLSSCRQIAGGKKKSADISIGIWSVDILCGPHVDQSKRIFKIKICQGRNSTDWQEWVILQLLWIRNNHLSGPHLKINLNILQRALCLYTIYKYNIISITLELLASQR